MKRRGWIVALILSVIFLTAFVFWNSLKKNEVSHSQSGTVAQWVEPMVDVFTDAHPLEVDYWVRKAAHVAEYGVLGLSVMALASCLERISRWKRYGVGLLYLLSVAVLDEFLQSLSDRSGTPKDVLLDLFGVLIGWGVFVFLRRIFKKKEGFSR